MAKQYYDTMSLDDLKKLPVPQLCDDNAALFLWCTYPQIPVGLELMKEWGFEYYGLGFEWIKKTKNEKDHFGMGYWTRANPEPCFLGFKGKMKPQCHNIRQLVHSPQEPYSIELRQTPQIVCSLLEQHSKKPDIVRQRIVELCGNLPRIELFARQESSGWDCWGNEI